MTDSKPNVGISACLLGDQVRHNAGHKKDDWVVNELGKWVEWHKTCPEVAMGLGVPRESMRLSRPEKNGQVFLVGNKTQKNYTELAEKTSTSIVSSLPQTLDGYILKNKSPSCGVEKVKVYDHNDCPTPEGVGFFAKELLDKFPDLPIIEEGRLNNAEFKEHFVTRIFAHFSIRTLPVKISAIQKHHESYKFVIHAHHETSLRQLGPIAANSQKRPVEEVYKEYKKVFLAALSHPATTKTRVNVLEHIYGFVKDKTTAKETKSIVDHIEQYRLGNLPFVAVAVLIRHLIEKHGSNYIDGQKFFSPYPEELKLFHEI